MRYFIRKGDTLSQIAQTHGTTVDAIMAANPQIKDRDRINAGDTLTIPGNGASLWDTIKRLFR